MGNNAPCRDCAERDVSAGHNCHDSCTRYREWVERGKKKKRRPEEWQFAGYQADRKQKVIKRLRLDKR